MPYGLTLGRTDYTYNSGSETINTNATNYQNVREDIEPYDNRISEEVADEEVENVGIDYGDLFSSAGLTQMFGMSTYNSANEKLDTAEGQVEDQYSQGVLDVQAASALNQMSIAQDAAKMGVSPAATMDAMLQGQMMTQNMSYQNTVNYELGMEQIGLQREGLEFGKAQEQAIMVDRLGEAAAARTLTKEDFSRFKNEYEMTFGEGIDWDKMEAYLYPTFVDDETKAANLDAMGEVAADSGSGFRWTGLGMSAVAGGGAGAAVGAGIGAVFGLGAGAVPGAATGAAIGAGIGSAAYLGSQFL